MNLRRRRVAMAAALATLVSTLVPVGASSAVAPAATSISMPASRQFLPSKDSEQTSESDPAQSRGNPVVGIPRPCAPGNEWPEDASPASVRRQLQANTGITLVGEGWDDPDNAKHVRIVWETLEAMACTDYLDVIKKNNPNFAINAGPISGWAFGDWGLTRPGALSLDFAKWHEPYRLGDRGRLVRLTVHEFGHAWSRTPEAQQTYEKFGRLYARSGDFSNYGHGSVNENFSEVIGYYVARCANGNPYDRSVRNQGQFDAYYELVKQGVFGGHEFGPEVGKTPNCSLDPVLDEPIGKPRTVRPASLARTTSARPERPVVKRVPVEPRRQPVVTRVIKESLDR